MTVGGATNYAGLSATVPGSGVGQLLGSGTNRFAVQIAYPIGATLGSFILGTSLLNEAVWNDVTTDVMSVGWDRGATSGQRPIAGQLTITLKNPTRRWSPSVSTYYGPGTIVRVACGDMTSLTSVQITAITQTWDESFTGGVRFVTITALENLSLLAGVTNPAVAPIGAGEGLKARCERVVAGADFPFALEFNYTPSTVIGPQTFQATTLDQEIIAELSLTVDSVDGVAFPAKNGKLEIAERFGMYRSTSYTLGAGGNVSIMLDKLTTANDDAILLSQVSLARVNGAETWTFTNAGIGSRYRTTTTSRDDLVIENDAHLSYIGTALLDRGTQTLRPVSADVIAATGYTGNFTFLMDVDLYKTMNVNDGTYVTFGAYAVCRLSHAITPMKNGVQWQCTVEFEPTADSYMVVGVTPGPGAHLLTRAGENLVTRSGDNLVWR